MSPAPLPGEGDGADAALPPRELLRALRRLRADGRIALHLDMKRLAHIDSPVQVEADGNIWVYGFIAAACLVWWRFGVLAAGGVVLLAILTYHTLARVYVRRRIRRRVEERALQESEIWQSLWRFGGVTLSSATGPGCVAPQGNWMALVRRLLAEENPAV